MDRTGSNGERGLAWSELSVPKEVKELRISEQQKDKEVSTMRLKVTEIAKGAIQTEADKDIFGANLKLNEAIELANRVNLEIPFRGADRMLHLPMKNPLVSLAVNRNVENGSVLDEGYLMRILGSMGYAREGENLSTFILRTEIPRDKGNTQYGSTTIKVLDVDEKGWQMVVNLHSLQPGNTYDTSAASLFYLGYNR